MIALVEAASKASEREAANHGCMRPRRCRAVNSPAEGAGRCLELGRHPPLCVHNYKGARRIWCVVPLPISDFNFTRFLPASTIVVPSMIP